MKKGKYLVFKAESTLRTDKLSEKTETIRNTNNGRSSMLMKLSQNQQLDLQQDLGFGSTDLSILFLLYQLEDILTLLVIWLLPSIQMDLTLKYGSSTGRLEPLSHKKLRLVALTQELHGCMYMGLLVPSTKSLDIGRDMVTSKTIMTRES
jgi:hypothetical protein